MGKTRAECSQNAYTSHASAFLSHWIQILANSSPKSDIGKKKKKNLTLFFRILRSVGRGQHNFFFFGLMMNWMVRFMWGLYHIRATHLLNASLLLHFDIFSVEHCQKSLRSLGWIWTLKHLKFSKVILLEGFKMILPMIYFVKDKKFLT